MSNEALPDPFLSLTAQIVAAHVGHNAVPANGMPTLIQQVYSTLRGLGAEPPAPEQREPAVPIKRSVFPDYIVCLEDGKKLKMLKRHLQTAYGMSVDQYREKWGLPPSYPMVAPNYAEHRSSLAKKIGLGRKPAVQAAPVVEPRRRGRKAADGAE
jgi:predicted transcriptional regulator